MEIWFLSIKCLSYLFILFYFRGEYAAENETYRWKGWIRAGVKRNKCSLRNDGVLPLRVRCCGECMEWKQNGVQVLRYEKPERNGDGMECIDLKHTDTINTCVLFPAQLMGGGEILWSIHMGWTRRREKKNTTGKRKKRAMGILLEWNLWNGKSVPSAEGCWGGCMNWRWNEVEVRSEVRTRVRNGNAAWKGMHLPQAHW